MYGFRVYYYDGIYGYTVYRHAETLEEAREFISVNAMVHPLPRVRLVKVLGFFPLIESEYPPYGRH